MRWLRELLFPGAVIRELRGEVERLKREALQDRIAALEDRVRTLEARPGYTIRYDYDLRPTIGDFPQPYINTSGRTYIVSGSTNTPNVNGCVIHSPQWRSGDDECAGAVAV